nr:hypothetical protein CFP56_19564 [Quercus suber]
MEQRIFRNPQEGRQDLKPELTIPASCQDHESSGINFDPSSSTSTAKPSTELADLETPATPLPILIRATDGKSQSVERKKNLSKVKLSTVVAPDQLEAFFTRYAEVCKAGMQSLKKRDRSKRKKDRGKKKKGKSGAAGEDGEEKKKAG